jgi:glutathione S-transferase
MTHGPPHFTLYSSPVSQWASVPLLGLVEKGCQPHEYDVKDIDLPGADNLQTSYLEINEHGTIPALTAPSLDKPLQDTREILEWIDESRPERGVSLAPKDEATKRKLDELIELVHSMKLNTSIILLQARDVEELEARKAQFGGYINTRQRVLEENCERDPGHAFYERKRKENCYLHRIYNTEVGGEHEEFFKDTHEEMKGFAKGMDELDGLLVLPFAAGEELSYADLHTVPWLAHALLFSGAKEINDFEGLEALLGKSESGWKVGGKVKAWWEKMQGTEGFKKVIPTMH